MGKFVAALYDQFQVRRLNWFFLFVNKSWLQTIAFGRISLKVGSVLKILNIDNSS